MYYILILLCFTYNNNYVLRTLSAGIAGRPLPKHAVITVIF